MIRSENLAIVYKHSERLVRVGGWVGWVVKVSHTHSAPFRWIEAMPELIFGSLCCSLALVRMGSIGKNAATKFYVVFAFVGVRWDIYCFVMVYYWFLKLLIQDWGLLLILVSAF